MTEINKNLIETAFENGYDSSNEKEVEKNVNLTIEALNTGSIRVSEKSENNWVVNQWIKKAILLSFKFKKNQIINKE